MIFRWYGYFSGKSNLHCTANLFFKGLRKQALRGDVELMVSCQCEIIIVMGTLVCWYVATMNTNLTLFVLFIYLFIIASTQGMAKTMVLVRLYTCHDTLPYMLFCDTITTLSYIILDASHHTHLWWMFLSCSVGGAGSCYQIDEMVVVASGHRSFCWNNNTIAAWR